MPIAEIDNEKMKEIAEYYRRTKTDKNPEGSIQATAVYFNMSRTKILKTLLTMGELTHPLTEKVVAFNNQGLDIRKIASKLGVSVSTVSMVLPYKDKVGNSQAPSKHTAAVRAYRKYIKEQKQLQAIRNPALEKTKRKPSQIGIDLEKEARMSFTENYHRPKREIREEMLEKLGFDASDCPEIEMIKRLAEERDKEKQQCRAELEALNQKGKLSRAEQKKRDELQKKLGLFPGALEDRDRKALETISGKLIPVDPFSVMRLHLEICDSEGCEEIREKTGHAGEKAILSRDIIVPSSIPLYALHYVIQQLFGWENSHLYRYYIPDSRNKLLTNNNASAWSCMVGLIYQSPFMKMEDEFWADDYYDGSFKNWLRKKYTGPYLSRCAGEGFLACQEDMMNRLPMEEEWIVFYKEADSDESIVGVIPTRALTSIIQDLYKTFRTEKMQFLDLPVESLRFIFDRDPLNILKRLEDDEKFEITLSNMEELASKAKFVVIDPVFPFIEGSLFSKDDVDRMMHECLEPAAQKTGAAILLLNITLANKSRQRK